MRVLCGCEESGVLREAFRARGFEAYSNDHQPPGDGKFKHHLQMDVFQALEYHEWDLIVMFPPCDFLTVAGNRWYGFGQERFHMRLNSVNWTMALWDRACELCDHVAMENPVGILPMDASQYVHPYEHGHEETKTTGLWLHGLPCLAPTEVLAVPTDAEEKKAWEKVWRMSPSPERKKLRSKTYQGIADAMAEQWGDYIKAPTGGHNSHQLRIC